MRRLYRIHLSTACIAAVLCATGAGGAETVGAPPEVSGEAVRIRSEAGVLEVSLLAPRLLFDGLETPDRARPLSMEGDPAAGDGLRVVFAPTDLGNGETVETTLHVAWSPEEAVLRKWAEVRLNGPGPRLLQEVVLDAIPLEGRAVDLDMAPPQSYPAFLPGFFAGVEFPIAFTRVEEGRLVLAHRPGTTLEPGQVYITRKAVYGAAPAGRERQTFKDYIARNRPTPTGLHVNYNSWWTSSVPFTEDEILRIMGEFERNLFAAHGSALDTFAIDLGWSNPQSIWEIGRERFPEGFSGIQAATQRMNAHLGLWISPSSFYGPGLDTEWAATAGYETVEIPWGQGRIRLCCLGGPRYAGAFRDRLVDMITRYGIRHVKLDGYYLSCAEDDHGHAPDPLSSEAVAEGGIAAFDAMHQAAPDVWLEATCFGWNPSPWWLFHVNSVIGTFGDDAPHGRVPAPVYRESYTTARDFFNLQGAAHLNVPIVAQEVLGLIHQTDEPFMNDAVDVVLRGHAFFTMYVNPKFMDGDRWKALARTIDWARNNPLVFHHTEPILPASWQDGRAPKFTNEAPMPREPYGYAHWDRDRGLVFLRNPWIRPATVAVPVGGHDGLAAGESKGAYSAVSLYPEPRLYGTGLDGGYTLEVTLAPYESAVLSFARDQDLEGLPQAADRIGGRVQITDLRQRVVRVEYQGEEGEEPFGPDWTRVTAPDAPSLSLDLEAGVEVAPDTDARLLILLEDEEPPSWPVRIRCTVDGRDLEMQTGSNDAGWAASSIPPGKERWQFIEGELPSGAHRLSVQLVGAGCSRISAWVYATRPGGGFPDYPNALPSPEVFSLDAAALLDTVHVEDVTEVERRPAEVVRLDGGVYLDTLTPRSVSQGYGELQLNRSITEGPLNIAGRRFVRGLGTHAESRIEYALDGQFSRFRAWAGANGGSHASITFEVWVDGEKRWESGLMTATDHARAVDVDVRGAQRLELLVGDGGNGIGADHANWADAHLLKG